MGHGMGSKCAWRLIVLFVMLALARPILVLGEGQDRDDQDRLVVFRAPAVATPSPFEPQLGSETLVIPAAVRMTEGLEGLSGRDKGDERDRDHDRKKYFIQLTWKIGSGASIAARTQLIPLVPPFTVVRLPHREGKWISLDGSLTWNGKGDSGTCLGDGSVAYSLKAEFLRQEAEDHRLRQEILGAVSATGSLTVRSTAPVVAIAQPTSGAFLNATPVAVVGTVSGAGPVGLTLGGRAVTVASSGAFSTAVALAADGPASLSFVATDCAGRTGQKTVSVFLDRSAPLVSIAVPSHAGATNNAKPTFTIAVTDPAPASGVDTSKLKAFLDGVDVSALLTVTATGATLTPATALNDGSHSLRVTSADRATNVGQGSQSIFVDTVKPLLTLSPLANSATANAHPAITATYVDPSPSSSLDPASVTMTLDGQTISPVVGTVQATYSVSATLPLSDGRHIVTAQVADQAQNVTQAQSSFLTDTKPPIITIVSPAPGSTVTTGSPSFQVTWSDSGSGIQPSSMRALVDAVDRTASFLATPTGATSKQAGAVALTASVHSFQISIADAVGNTATSTAVFTVAPSVVTTTPADPAGYVSGEVLDFSGHPVPGVAVSVVGQAASSVTAANGRYSFALAPGRYRLKFAKDGFAAPERNATVESGRGSVTRQVVLMPTDPRSNPIVAANGGIVQNAAGDVEIDIPPGALTQDANISVTALPNDRSLPDDRRSPAIPGLSVAIQPEGLQLTAPVTVKVANRTHLQPGHKLMIWAFNHATGVWQGAGTAAVSADGTQVVGTSSHFSFWDFI